MISRMRKRDFQLIAHQLGIIMQGIGIVVLVPIIIAFIYQEGNYIGFILPSLFSISLGFVLTKYSPVTSNIKLKHGMIIAALAWLWAAFIGTLALLCCTDLHLLDAFFESMSAWTGSGLTIFDNVELLPKSVLFLRSIEQWIGGLGVVIVVIGILIRPGTAAARLYKSEAREEKIKPSITGTVKIIWWIYIFYTIMGIILYLLAGMSLFDAINNTFTNLSTGGMSVKNNNIGAYASTPIYLVTMFLMIVGGTSFLIHYRALKGKLTDVLRDIQFQAMIIIIITFSCLLLVFSKFTTMEAVFNVVSALSCTGSSINNTNTMVNWPDFAKIILITAMIIGMAAGSTTGALKLIRVVTVIKGMYWEILKIISPEGRVIRRQISGKSVDDTEIREAGSYAFIYLVFILMSWLVLVLFGYDGVDALFEVASAQGNVGLSMGITAATMPTIAQAFLIINMWIGRIEIIPALVFLKVIVDTFNRF